MPSSPLETSRMEAPEDEVSYVSLPTATTSNPKPSPDSMLPAPEAEAKHLHGWQLQVLIVGLCLSVLLVGLDFTMLATAVPTITSDFNSLQDVSWYGSAFLIAVCACQLLAGNLFSKFPHRWVYSSFIVIFEVGSLISALAHNSRTLIVGRAITGIGASGLFGGSLIVISSTVPTQNQPIYLGIVQATFILSELLGPIIGGAFTANVTWRWCFWINLPIGGLTLLVVLMTLSSRTEGQPQGSVITRLKSLDFIGFTLFSGAVTMLLLALQYAGVTYAWNSSQIIGLFVGFGVTFAVFLGWQFFKGNSASVPPAIFTHRTVLCGFFVALFGNGGFYVVLYYLQIWFQAVKSATPLKSGLMYLPTVGSNILTAVTCGSAVTKMPYYNPFLLFGLGCLAIGGGLDTMLRPDSYPGYWAGFQVFCGIGFALLVQMPIVAIQRDLKPMQVPIGTTLIVLGQAFSAALFLAAAQPVFESVLRTFLTMDAPDVNAQLVIDAGVTGLRGAVRPQQLPGVISSYNAAVTRVFFITVGCALVSFLFACALPWNSFKPPPNPNETTKES